MRRRTFLKAGIVAGIGLSLPSGELFAAPDKSSIEHSIAELLQTGMIWSSQSLPVPVKQEGAASSIASSSKGAEPIPAVDLHTVFIKELLLSQTPVSAELHLFAYTRYRLYLNGRYVGRGPSRFQNQRPEYDTRNVAPFLQAGRNVIAVLVHRDAPTGRIMSHNAGFAAVLEWQDKSGDLRRMVTDTSWRAKSDPSFGVRDQAWSSIEEHIDARNAERWGEVDFDPKAWTYCVPVGGFVVFPLWPRTTPLQTEKLREWRPRQPALPMVLNAPADIEFELPEIIQGYHDLEFEADEASEFEVSYLLPEKQKSGSNTYIARAGVQTYLGGDTFAFNKLQLHLKSGRIKLTKASAFEVRYPFERVGSFDSSDPFLNQLWAICARSLEVLSEDSYVDCADRERVEWIDDSPPAFDCTRVMMAGPGEGNEPRWSDSRLLKALLRRAALTQGADGQLKAHTCSDRWDIHAIMEDRSCDWVMLLRQYYEATGDIVFVRELWPSVVSLLDWFLHRRTARGLVLAREWEMWDNPLRYQVCEGAGLNALAYCALRDGSWLGNAAGQHNAAAHFTEAAHDLAAVFNRLLWSEPDGAYFGGLFGPGSHVNERLGGGPPFVAPRISAQNPDGHYQPTLQAALLAMECGIVPGERRAPLFQWVLSHLDEADGPMSHHYLFKALYSEDSPEHDRLVLEIIRRRWKNQVESPWQTTWEDLVDRGGSKVHIYGMLPGYHLSSFVLGVRRSEPVEKRRIVIEPRMGDLLWAKGTVVTEFGPVPVSWSRAESAEPLKITATVPKGVMAALRIPGSTKSHTVVLDARVAVAQQQGRYLAIALGPGPHSVEIHN